MNIDQYRTNESKLIELLSGGSEYAFQFIYDRYNSRIYRTALRYLKSPVLAQDVVQDVFLKLWFERTNIRENHSLEAWLCTVAKNMLINRLKKIGNERKALHNLPAYDDKSGELLPGHIDEAYYHKLLKEAMGTLSNQQYSVFELVRNERLSYLQAAERLGISPLTVKTHMSRALSAIREFFIAHGVVFVAILYLIGS